MFICDEPHFDGAKKGEVRVAKMKGREQSLKKEM